MAPDSGPPAEPIALSSHAPRWEDWPKLALDPSDDCTFWYFGGYGNSAVSGGPYLGRVGAFRLPTCRLDATGRTLQANAGKAFDGAVATFTDSDPTATAGSFTVGIDWGAPAHPVGFLMPEPHRHDQ